MDSKPRTSLHPECTAKGPAGKPHALAPVNCYRTRGMSKQGKVWLVGAGPGDPELITVRGRELLQQATVVLYDALAHAALLEECSPTAILVSVGKRLGAHTVPQAEITRMLIDYAKLGHEVVRLKGGDPYLFARGAEEAEELVKAGVSFGVVPGISSPVGTATYAGFALTHRELSSSVTFVTGTDKHGELLTEEAWSRLAAASDTLCILMGMKRIESITESLMVGGRVAQTPAAVIQWGARPEQRVLTATLGTLAAKVREAGFTNPSVIVVGDVVRLRESLRWYDTSGLFGKRLLLPRPLHQAKQSAKEVRRAGAIPIVLPLLSIEDPEDPEALKQVTRRLSSYDWVILTSANGAARFVDAIRGAGLDARALGGVKVAVIGPKTAGPLREFGVVADVVAAEHVAEGLLSDLQAQGPLRRVLIVRAAEAREVLPDTLRQWGAEVDVVAAYWTRRLGPSQAENLRQLLVEGGADAVLVTSSSMAKALVEALGPQAKELLGRCCVSSIGPVTTETLRSLGIRSDVVAEKYTVAGLLDALARKFQATALGSP